VVESLTQATNYYEKAAQATASGNIEEAVDCNYRGCAYQKLAIVQATYPNPAVVEGYTQEVDYFKNAATAQADGKEKKAEYWSNAGIAYVKITDEQAKDEPNKGTVRRLEYAISCFQHAAKAEAENESEEAIYWEKLGDDSMK
jgi:hypothetical protein